MLAGLSRKSTLGAITGRESATGSRAASPRRSRRSLRGARILRVHDVRETVDALAVWRAIQARTGSGMPSRPNNEQDPIIARRYFGTDGMRGRVGESPITPD